MSPRIVLALIALLSIAACAPTLQRPSAVESISYPSPASEASHSVAIRGAVQLPMTLDLATLRALPPSNVSAGGHNYTGASLWTILKDKALIKGTQSKNPTVSMYLVAHGTDGYRVVLALAEIDPDFGNRQAIIAYAVEGEPINRGGALRLIVPGDVKLARSVSMLDSIELVAITAPAIR